MKFLAFNDSLGNTKRVEVDKPVFSLGRQIDNDLQVLGASVSRRHAVILTETEGLFVVDKESKGGTFVNGERITRQRLKHGDRIRLGGSSGWELRFQDDSVVEAAAAPHLPPEGKEEEESGAPNAHAELQNLARFLDVNQALKVSLSIEEVLRLIVDAAIEISRADRGALLLQNKEGDLEFRVARDSTRRSLRSSDFEMSRTAADQAFREGRSIILAAALAGDGPLPTESALRLDLRTIICIPLQRLFVNESLESTVTSHRREIVGVLYVDSRSAAGTLTRSSISFLESLAFEAAKSLENLRLMQQEEEKHKLERELATAREVQLALLTTSRYEDERVEVSASSLPSRYVDGDFYDILALGRGRIAVILGDVAGKGISAALLAAMAQGVLHTQLAMGVPIPVVIRNLNRLLVAKSASWRFLTLFCGLLEPDGRFCFVNAGHNPPILARRDGGSEMLFPGSMVVGIMEDTVYEAHETRVCEGDVLLAYTDGLTEAMSPGGDMFGERRLEDSLRGAGGLSAENIRGRIVSEVKNFIGGAVQEDDVTVMALKVKAGESQE